MADESIDLNEFTDELLEAPEFGNLLFSFFPRNRIRERFSNGFALHFVSQPAHSGHEGVDRAGDKGSLICRSGHWCCKSIRCGDHPDCRNWLSVARRDSRSDKEIDITDFLSPSVSNTHG